MPDDEEYSDDPRCDHNGFCYANTGYEDQSHFSKTMVLEQKTGYEGWPEKRLVARSNNRMGRCGAYIHMELGLSRDEEVRVRHLDHMVTHE